jgi:hypothetical protein
VLAWHASTSGPYSHWSSSHRCAADLIRAGGYNLCKPEDSAPGYSVSTALCTVTGGSPSTRHIPGCEDLHGRVAGYLYLTGRISTGRTYLPNAV